jgi:hypothetical protein
MKLGKLRTAGFSQFNEKGDFLCICRYLVWPDFHIPVTQPTGCQCTVLTEHYPLYFGSPCFMSHCMGPTVEFVTVDVPNSNCISCLKSSLLECSPATQAT